MEGELLDRESLPEVRGLNGFVGDEKVCWTRFLLLDTLEWVTVQGEPQFGLLGLLAHGVVINRLCQVDVVQTLDRSGNVLSQHSKQQLLEEGLFIREELKRLLVGVAEEVAA